MKSPYPWEAGTFDAIVCSEVLEHLWDLRVVHKEAKRLLTRTGLYVISTPNMDWITNHLEHYRRILSIAENHWTFEHIRHYNFDVHKKYLNDAGFVIEKHQGADEHYCPVFANVAQAIHVGLRERGIEVPTAELGVMLGKGVPHYQHTVIIAARKA
jgi:SAM-dependent methyltransferase